jgi:hypothetical protein
MTPSGIILSSGSQGATKESLESVLTKNGFEPEKPEVVAPVEPKPEDFESDEEWEKAKAEFDAATEDGERKEEEEKEAAGDKPETRQQHKPTRRQKAVEKATKELREELAKANERLAALETGKGKAAATETVKPPTEPKREDFKSDKEFDDALFDYRYKLRRANEEVENAQKRLNDGLAKNFADYKDAVADFKEDHDDWDEVVDQKLAIPQAVYYAIVDLGKEGPRVTYHLGQHPEVVDELAEMTPYRAAIEVGRLADKLKGGKPSTENPKPKPRVLPEPVRTLSTNAAQSSLTRREAAAKRDYKSFKVADRAGR